MGERITTSNRYEAAYYLTNGCALESVQFSEENGRDWVYFTFRSSEGLERLQTLYQGRQALVEVHQFKAAFSQVGIYVAEARRRDDVRGAVKSSAPKGGAR